MEDAIHSLQKAIDDGRSTEKHEKRIAEKIKEAIDYPEFFELGINCIKNILRKCEAVDIRTARIIIRYCKKFFGDEGLSVLEYMVVKENKFDIIGILGSLEYIPVMNTCKKIIIKLIENNSEKDLQITQLKKEIELKEKELEGCFEVDWETEYKREKREREKSDHELVKLRREICDIKGMALPKSIIKPRDGLGIIKCKDIVDAIKSANIEGIMSFIGSDGKEEKCMSKDEALLIACREAKIEVIDFLVSEGANVNTKDKDGDTALMYAYRGGDVRTVSMLMAEGAKVNEGDKNGDTVLMHACKEGNYEMVITLTGVENVNLKNKYNDSALMHACRNGNLEIIKHLISRGASYNQNINRDYSPLSCALYSGNLEVAKYLISLEKNKGEKYISNALIQASFLGYKEIVEILISVGVNYEWKNKSGTTPLMGASQSGFLEIVQLLVSNGASINDCDNDRNTALMLASQYGHLDIVKFLISKNARTDCKDINKNTALTKALRSGHKEIVEFLKAHRKGAGSRV